MNTKHSTKKRPAAKQDEVALPTNRHRDALKPNAEVVRVAYSTREVADKLGISPKSVYRMLDRGLLQKSKACRKNLIAATSVDNFVEVTS